MKSVENYPRRAESPQPLRIGITSHKTELDQSTSFLNNPDLRLIPRIADVEAASTEWVVEDLIAQGEYHLISGAPASMKSMLALVIADGIRKGTEVLGRQTMQNRVGHLGLFILEPFGKHDSGTMLFTRHRILYWLGANFRNFPDSDVCLAPL